MYKRRFAILSMSCLPTFTLLILIACSLPWVESQLCDDNPLANKGMKISVQASSSCLKGRTPDMSEVGTCQDNSAHDIRLPFAFNFFERSYNGGVFVSSNSYVTFGGSSTAFSDLGPKTPEFPTVFIGGRDNAMRNLSVGPDALGWRVRYEGWSLPSLVNTHNCSLLFAPTLVWELTFLYNGTLQLCTGFYAKNVTGVSAVSDGTSGSFVQKFILTPSTSYTISTGLGLCECDGTSQIGQGLKITTQHSQSCMKGRTPDMIDLGSCKQGGSTNILLPFPFSFLGRTYGGQNDDVFVGDSSFVTFGGAYGNFYSSFEADISDLPMLLVGARQNVLKTLSVAPDPFGWRVRYEGWSNHGASLNKYPNLEQAFLCDIAQSFAANITWELLFSFDGTLQLCTSSIMANLDPIFDSFSIKERVCSSLFVTMCTNFFQNLTAISAVSDGRSGSFLHKFDLKPSTLYTISTGVHQCSTACDDNPQLNKGVKIVSHDSSSCLKRNASDMTVVGGCSDFEAYSIRLPFPFHFLGVSYSGGDVFVGSNSYITFGRPSTTSFFPPIPALLIGSRDNALKRLFVGPDPLGWRVRFEGWDRFMSLYRTIDCDRPANVVWELLFMFNNTMQLCSGSDMANLDMALLQNAESALWDGSSVVAYISLAASSVYSISTSLLPCFLDLSLSHPIASVNGSSLTARFPANLRISGYNLVTLTITLQGTGFYTSPNTSIVLLSSFPCSRATGEASIINSTGSAPLLTVSIRGILNCSLVSFTLPSVTTPLLHQSFRKNIRFSVSDQNKNIFFSSASGTLVEIMQDAMTIEAGEPFVQLINNAIESSTTINITLIPNRVNIPAEFAASVLVITLAGAGWSLISPAQGRIIRPARGVFESATIAEVSSNTPVLRVTFSGSFSISKSSTLELLVFNVATLSFTQPAVASIRSAILNSAGSIIAIGTNGRLDAVIASTMGAGSPTVTVVPPVVSISGVRIDVTLTPQPLRRQMITLPALIIITLTGSEFTCSSSTVVSFVSPFDATSGTLNVSNAASKSIMTIGMTSGTISSGHPVSFYFGPCSTPPRAQLRAVNVAAAMIDGSGATVAASSTGTLSEIVENFGHVNLLLTNMSLSLTFTPRLMVPSNSFLLISMTGVGLVCNEATAVQFSQPSSGAFGTASIASHPLGSVLNVSLPTEHSINVAVVLTISPVYGGCSSNVGDVLITLFDKAGNILAANATSNFTAKITDYPATTVQQLINVALNGVIIIPDGIYAGRCNCNNRIDEKVPSRKPDAPVEMKGTSGRSIIDCSGTGLRCLIVQNSTLFVVDIIFKGGSSPIFISLSTIAAVRAIFDAENQTFTAQYNQGSRTASSAKDALRNDPIGTSMRLVDELDDHGKKEAGRHLLQSGPLTSLPTFNTRMNESGGCILVLAPAHSVSLSGVRLIRCSAIYGGGGFFNVTHFDAKNSIADGNFARQGGGMFVAASDGTEIELCNFLNNTVSSSLISQRPGVSSPHPAWAAGAGVWLQRLTTMKRCIFERNLALAAKSSSGSGSHAVGSALFVLQTSSGSILSDLLFIQSASLCAGEGCYSAGSAFIVVAGKNTSILGFTFLDCQVTAVKAIFGTLTSPPVEASAACISVIDSSAGMLKVEKVRSTNCSARSSGVIYGGCMNFSTVNNSVVSQISVFGFNSNASFIFSLVTPFSKCGAGGIAMFAILQNTIISNFSVDSVKWQCMGDSTGAVIQAEMVANVTFSSVHVSNIIYSGVVGRLFGGVFYFVPISSIFLTNIYIQNSSFVGRSFNGALIFVGPELPSLQASITGVFAVRGLFVRNVSSLAESVPEFSLLSPRYAGDGAISCISLNVYPTGPNPMTIKFEGLTFQNISVSCAVAKCSNYGIMLVRTELMTTAYRTLDDNSQSLYISNASFENVHSSCKGSGCSVRGACLALTVRDATLMHIRLKSVTASSNGSSSFAGGSFLFHFHNNPLKSFRISNVTSDDAKVLAFGSLSTAIGGVIVAVYGNLVIDNVRFMRSYVSCASIGSRCQSIGGSVAFASSLVPSNKRENEAFSAILSNSLFGHTVVECLGESCEATGGAVFAGTAFRGPFEQVGAGTQAIAGKGIKLLPLIVHFHNCSIIGNLIKSESAEATLSGAGISILLSDSTITNSIISGNGIESTQPIAFAGGGGIYVSGQTSSASVVSTIIKLNNAGKTGSGGAIFAALGSTLICQQTILDFNIAKKGGGLFVDTASASVLSSTVSNNSASEKGGGIFCVSLASVNATSSLLLSNVTVSDNMLGNDQPQSVGAAVYIFGDVFIEVGNGTRFLIRSGNEYTTTEAILSISRQANISSDTVIVCKSGSVLSVAFTAVVNQNIKLAEPRIQEQFETQCNPACLFKPEITPYTASGGFMASCVPCPRGTYSLTASSDTTDSVASKCQSCPFGASCKGGSSIGALKSHWGWKVSERELTSRFVLLPPGYACTENCTSISPCGGNRAGILCGACAANYSVAFFTTSCVPSMQCSSWKWAPLVVICIAFQFLFSIWFFQYSSESEMLQNQVRIQSLSRHALEHISLFQNLSRVELDVVVSKMELVHFAARSTVFVQGSSTSCLYIIETGALTVYLHDGFGNEILLATLMAPNVVGEQSLISSTACSASVRALVDSELWRLDRSCLDNIAEDDKQSFARAKQAQYIQPAFETISNRTKDTNDDLWRPLAVLMWFYQLVGIMLSVSSPLDYVDGSAASFSVVSFLVNARPSYQAASEVSTQTSPSFSAGDAGPFQFCVSSSFFYSQMYLATLMYYVAWALLMVLLVQKLVWKFVRSMMIRFILGITWVWGAVLECFKICAAENVANDFAMNLRERLHRRQSLEIEIRGPVLLKWFVTCFSAVASLMMQGTACIRLNGLRDAADELRWIYDGRVACFVNTGELPGQWQLAPAIGVVFVLIAPAVLWRIMLGIQHLDDCLRTPFQQTLLEAYSGPYFSHACHWMVVMFYQRLIMMVTAIYFESSPFFQAYTMLCLCVIILSMEFLYRPYKNICMQVLSCSSAFCLLAICGLLLRSQSLVSASRSPNFMPSDPARESDTVSNELNPVIWFLIILLVAPALIAIILQPLTLSVFRAAVTALRKTKVFGRIFMEQPTSMQSISLQEEHSTRVVTHAAVISPQSEDTAFAPDKPRKVVPLVNLNETKLHGIEFSDDSQILARRTTLPYPSVLEPI